MEPGTDSGTVDASGNRRRSALKGMAGSLTVATLYGPLAATAAVPELDQSGQLFSPKSEMLSGGTKAARGIKLRGSSGRQLNPGEAYQTVYGARFITYLARFLLNFDPAANAWWSNQGYGETWEEFQSDQKKAAIDNAFAEFAESVEIGLTDYFLGPYGSYSSLSAAKAGLQATEPAQSQRPLERRGVFEKLILGNAGRVSAQNAGVENVKSAKQGVLNLLTLLKARYKTVAAKRQLATLFSFMSPGLQPTTEISGLLGEADNATITDIGLLKYSVPSREAGSRTSPRRGGGYALDSFPIVKVASPPPLGDDFKQAMAAPTMKPTSRVLRIDVIDGGEGYKTPPQVDVVGQNIQSTCQATAILDRKGRVESIVVLDPGYGYGQQKEVRPRVLIDPPKEKRGASKRSAGAIRRRARAVAELEYEIIGVDIVSGGSGYVMTEPPQVDISPPEVDPDWFITVQDLPDQRMQPLRDELLVEASVFEMKFAGGNVAYSVDDPRRRSSRVTKDLLYRMQRQPLEMLPSYIRPELRRLRFTGEEIYTIPSLDAIPEYIQVQNPRFRAQDPVFGGVGKVPVTKGPTALSSSEYARLALSGAVCTVLVRTALNPLELIKTKQQLNNDPELFDFAKSRVKNDPLTNGEGPIAHENGISQGGQKILSIDDISLSSSDDVATIVGVDQAVESKLDSTFASSETPEKAKLGTTKLLQSLVELRGPGQLFHSADITFLASLVFGSFGFGATELFRRSVSAKFLEGGADSALSNEFALLAAASLATIVTAAAASPFEVLRVKSMGLIEDKKWTYVLQDFIEEKTGDKLSKADGSFDFKAVRFKDVTPLWSGFGAISSRELPFAVTKFLVFDLMSRAIVGFLNSQTGDGALPIQVGVGPVGLTISAASGAIAGIVGAIISHPADLILTKTSVSSKGSGESDEEEDAPDWREVLRDIISQDGGLANLFVGLPARATFFFLVIGLQFFLYDYVKGVFQVGSDDLSLVLDVFYAVRAGLTDAI